MNTSDTHYNVIIVGGRPAGASLAARLGQQNIKTLIIERATFPSGAAVSSPFILAHTMELLDEIGADESQYARNTPKMRRFVLEFKDHFRVYFDVAAKAGRDYMYTVERERFDTTLWNNLDQFPSVTKLEGFSVTDLTSDQNGRVTGIIGRAPKKAAQTLTADAVIGADGRFSIVAQKAGAKVTEEETDILTTQHYAYWENVAPYDEHGDPLPHIHTSVDGFAVVFMPSADGRISVVTQAQPELYDQLDGNVQERYLHMLKQRPYVWRRLQNATQVTKLSGMKRIPNLFRQAAGDGWALVGDAYHQKDSYDAQGIYDALISSKLLAAELTNWHTQQKSWAEAMATYDQTVYAALKPTFDATIGRVKREMYEIPPEFVAKNVLRWAISSDAYREKFSQQLIRQVDDPVGWTAPPNLLKMILSGMLADFKRKLTRTPNPFTVPPVTHLPQNPT